MADSVWKRIKEAIFPDDEKVAPAEPKLERRGVFSTDIEIDDEDYDPAEKLAEYMEDLKSKAPAPSPSDLQAAGYGMDSSDGARPEFKKVYSWNDNSVSDALMMWYASQGFIGHQACAMLMQNWLINKVCTRPAEDAIRHWFDIVSADGEKLPKDVVTKLRRADRKFKLKKKLTQFIRKGRGFGMMIAIFRVESDDDKYYENPFNPDGIKPGSYRGISLVEPYWCSPLLDIDASSTPDSDHFYEPTWWVINGRKYHRTHLEIYIQDEVADILKPSYFYGGIPVPQKILERVYAAERTANEAPHLAMSKRTTILKTDAAKAYANLPDFMRKLLEWVRLRDNHAVKVIDMMEEDINQLDTSLADFDSLMMSQYQLVAAAGDTPATKLIETTPKGFNATGEYEDASYHETLESIQEHNATPLTEKHHICVLRSEGIADIETTVAWKPLDSPTALEYAQIRETNARTDVMLIEANVLETIEARRRVQADENGGYTFLTTEEEEYGDPEGEAFSEEGDLATAI